tara:strand:+ start:594 stop:878 length:285 start_codon:yes stop_codon:yes gene_type:complete
MKIERINAVYAVHPETRSSDDDGFYNADGEKIVLDEDAVSKKEAELKSEYDALQYQRDRAVAYDPIPEQLDQIYHDMDGWKAKIKAVKDKYPKP